MREESIFEIYLGERGYKARPCEHRPEEVCYEAHDGRRYTKSDIKISAHYWGFFHGLRSQKILGRKYSESSLKQYSAGQSLAMKFLDSQRVR